MKILKISRDNFNEIIKKAAKAIKQGKVLIFPTDTVYGLLCDSRNEKAVEKIFRIKKRPKTKPLPVFVEDIRMAKKLAFINKEQENFLKKSWPGAKTIVLRVKANNKLPKLLIKNDTIALRMPDYKLILDLISKIKRPLAQTSANISGKETFTNIKEILNQFEKSEIKPDLAINGGNISKRKPSKIVDLTTKKFRILRK